MRSRERFISRWDTVACGTSRENGRSRGADGSSTLREAKGAFGEDPGRLLMTEGEFLRAGSLGKMGGCARLEARKPFTNQNPGDDRGKAWEA